MLLKQITLGMTLCLLFSSSFSQTCNTSITASTPDSRFTPQGNGTVLDTQTNLIWKRCSEGQVWDGSTGNCTGSASTYNWQGALDAAQTLNSSGGFASHTDWRVPNIKELASIVELKCYDPAINLTIFPNTSSNAFVWSSSPIANFGSKVWPFYFGYGYYGGNTYLKSDVKQVRLVRSGQ